MPVNEHIIKMWNCAARLKHAVKYCEHKGINKQEVVAGHRMLAKTYGYSGSVPIRKAPNRRPLAIDWTDLGGGLSFSKSNRLYWKDGVTRDEDGAILAVLSKHYSMVL